MIMILGGTGMLGHKLFQSCQTKYPDTHCTIHGHASDTPYDRIDMFQRREVIQGVNMLDFTSVSELLLRFKPSVVINCVGVIKQRHEDLSYISAIKINSLLPHQLAQTCAQWGGRLIHFSTDCVFSGRQGMYKESSLSDAEDLYGKTKFLGETVEENALTIRTSIIGRELVRHRSLLDWFLSNRGGKVMGFSKSIYSGVTTNHLAEVVMSIIEHHSHLQGVYQVASAPISKYGLLCLLRDAYSLDILIEPVDGENVDRSMDGAKLRGATGYVCPSWPELVRQLAADSTPYSQWLAASE